MEEKTFVVNVITTQNPFAADNWLEVEKIRAMKSQNTARTLCTTQIRCMIQTLKANHFLMRRVAVRLSRHLLCRGKGIRIAG